MRKRNKGGQHHTALPPRCVSENAAQFIVLSLLLPLYMQWFSVNFGGNGLLISIRVRQSVKRRCRRRIKEQGLLLQERRLVASTYSNSNKNPDDYLAYCDEQGIEPDKSYTGVLNVRLTPAIHRQVAMLARKEGMTLNAFIKEALEQKVEAAVAM